MLSEKIFVWVAHPGAGSYNSALADAYVSGAVDAGAQVRRMDLHAMQFSSDFGGYKNPPALEPDLRSWQENLLWADRVMFIHPLWWGAMPGRAKTVLDRCLEPGFAYRYQKGPGIKIDRLLEGRVGDAIITADTPEWVDSWLYSKPARRVISKHVLEFCGIKPRNVRFFGSVKLADDNRRDQWLAAARGMGAQLGETARDRVAEKTLEAA